jgi:hypothetical protein
MAVGEAFPTGSAFLLVKSSFPSLKTPTVLSQQELGNPIGKAFTNRVGVFANNLALLAKHTFPVVLSCVFQQAHGKHKRTTTRLFVMRFPTGARQTQTFDVHLPRDARQSVFANATTTGPLLLLTDVNLCRAPS